jgi:hypothetical protein
MKRKAQNTHRFAVLFSQHCFVLGQTLKGVKIQELLKRGELATARLETHITFYQDICLLI